jgi:beta-glucanase (GH16 family)
MSCLRLGLLLLSLSLTACSANEGTDPDPIPAKDGFRLVWNDEFDGTSIDGTAWNWEVHGRPANNELQYYTRAEKNSRIEDGVLVLEAHKEVYTGPDATRNYTSARINTSGKHDFTYGRFEIRARMPVGRGMWPAIWMMPTDSRYGGWPRSGEIDIMEYLGHDLRAVYQTIHYTRSGTNDHGSSGTSYRLTDGTFSQDFHVFALEWEAGEMRWYVDNLQVGRQNSWHTLGAPFPAPFDQRFHVILNLAVGGDWPGNPDASTPFPGRMEVDYVRVFERIE